jgi:hypothetical protein
MKLSKMRLVYFLSSITVSLILFNAIPLNARPCGDDFFSKVGCALDPTNPSDRPTKTTPGQDSQLEDMTPYRERERKKYQEKLRIERENAENLKKQELQQEKLRIERENAENLKKQELQQEAEKLANSCEDKLIYNPTNYICPESSYWKAIPGSSGTCQSISRDSQNITFHKDYKEVLEAADIKYTILEPDKVYSKRAGYSAILTEFQIYPALVPSGSYKTTKGSTIKSHQLVDKAYFEISQKQSQNEIGLYIIKFHKDICPL